MHVWKGRKRPYQRGAFRCTNLVRPLLCFRCVSTGYTDAVAMIHIVMNAKMYRTCTLSHAPTHTRTQIQSARVDLVVPSAWG